jgi:predicted anti-sigma-YlaC factor YlaD
MNNCIDNEIQELLPDLLHQSLDGATRQRVETHLATCESCREELDVLRTVKGAAVFAPMIDADSIVRQIPPYRMIVPGVEQPKRTRMVSWLVAAGFALAVIGGGALVVSNQSRPTQPVASSATVTPSQSTEPVTVEPETHALALASAADLSELSDGSLVQLMNEMDDFDALPASEIEPVIAVDSVDSL